MTGLICHKCSKIGTEKDPVHFVSTAQGKGLNLCNDCYNADGTQWVMN